jgi:hypothetical protein
MPESAARIYPDEDVSVLGATILRARGFEAVTARDTGQLGRSDPEQLTSGALAERVLLTHNQVDCERPHRQRLEVGRPHAGIITLHVVLGGFPATGEGNTSVPT